MGLVGHFEVEEAAKVLERISHGDRRAMVMIIVEIVIMVIIIVEIVIMVIIIVKMVITVMIIV